MPPGDRLGGHLSLSCHQPLTSRAYYAETKKHNYYDADFKGTQFEFAAMVFESTGGANKEGLAILRQLFRFEGAQCLLWWAGFLVTFNAQ